MQATMRIQGDCVSYRINGPAATIKGHVRELMAKYPPSQYGTRSMARGVGGVEVIRSRAPGGG